MLRIALCLWSVSLVVGMASAGVLVEDGKSAGCIVLPANAPKMVQTAANDLAGYIRQMSGASVPIFHDSEPCPGFRILLGSTKLSLVDPSSVTQDKLGYGGFIVKSIPNGLAIAGGIPRGTANGVYYFAEEVLGVHWYSVEDNGPSCPQRKTIRIPELDVTVKPEFAWRSQYLSFQEGSPAYSQKTAPMATKLGANRDRWWAFNRHWGISADSAHVFFQIVPGDLYDTHPEYFPYINYAFAKDSKKRVYAGPDGALPAWPFKAGRHKGDNSVQRCLSNPDVLRMAIEYTQQRFKSDPDLRFTTLSANDGPWWCECDACKAMGHTETERNLAFANAVARANERLYPDRGYIFVAYWDTLEPPVSMKTHPNVVPMIARLWQCRIHPISSNCPDSAYTRRVFKEWQRTAGRTAFHLYTTPGPFTFPGPVALAEQMRFLRDSGSIGGFREHQFAPRVNWQMLAWMEIRLMWDVNQDPIKLRDQFIEGYYGRKAAPAIRKVYDVIETASRQPTHDRTWPKDEGDGLHSVPGEDIFKPIVAQLQDDVDAALREAQSEREPFKLRIIRDMEMLLGKNKAEF